MQSYAILDARTPGIVNIVSNKNCKEWRIDALRKSKCVCALFVLTEKEFEMKKKIGTVIVACIVMSCVLIGCQETNGDEGNVNSTLDQQRQDTTDSNINVEQEESGIEEFLNITYNELVATEKTLTLSYYEGGGSPVYAVEEYEGVYIVYPAVSDEPQMNNLAESISDEIPVKLVIRNSETEIHPGLRVGMPAEKVNNLNIAWDDVYMSSENSLYYTSFKRDENEVTAAWAIPDDMFSEWSASLDDEDDYYAKFLEFIQPFKSEPVGTIVELSVKKVEGISDRFEPGLQADCPRTCERRSRYQTEERTLRICGVVFPAEEIQVQKESGSYCGSVLMGNGDPDTLCRELHCRTGNDRDTGTV